MTYKTSSFKLTSEYSNYRCWNGRGYTVNPALSSHSKRDKTKILMTNGNLMKIENIAERSAWIILQYF